MFQIIVGAGVGHKDVHDDAGIIQQHPVLGVEALGGVGLDALLRKLVLHLVGQSTHLGGGGAGSNDEVIGQNGQALHFEHADIHGLFLIQDLCDLNGKGLAVDLVFHKSLLSGLLLSRGLAVGGGRTCHVGIAAQDGIIGLLVQLSHELDVGAGGSGSVGPVVGHEVHFLGAHGAGVIAEIGVQQLCNGTGIRHHAGVTGKGVGLAHIGHAHEHRRLRQNDVGAVEFEEGHHQLCNGGNVHIRLDIVLEHQRQLVQDIGDTHGAGTLEQAGIEIALHVQAVDIGIGVAVAVAAAHKELCRCTVQIAVALEQLAAAVGHIVGEIHLDAAKVIHHIHQCLHIHRHIVIDGQSELIVDDIGQSGDAAAVGDRHRVDLIIRGGVGLSIGARVVRTAQHNELHAAPGG